MYTVLHHILSSAHTYTRATARRDSSDSLRTARHVQAQRESRVESHDTALAQQSLSKHVHLFPDLPPWCANCVGASGLRKVSFLRHRDAPQRPVTRKGHDTRLLMYTALHHILSSAHTYIRATARRDSFIH